MGCRSSTGQPENVSATLIRSTFIRRLAIDQSAQIGSLYDATVDCLLETPILTLPFMSNTPLGTMYHPMIDTGMLEGTSLAKMIGIDKELCLSIYLNLVVPKGIPFLLKCPYTINKYTRFFSYFCQTGQTRWNGEPDTFRLQSVDVNTATHVVTGIQYGVHAIVVLQVSPEYELKLDELLRKLKDQLNRSTLQIEPDEEDLFNQFTEMHVFSNIPDLEQLTKFTEVYQKITEITSDPSRHQPMEYTLRSIRWFLPSYSADRGHFHTLKEEYINEIDTYLCQLSSVRRSLKVPIDSETQQLLEIYLKQQFGQIQQELLLQQGLYRMVKNQCFNFILSIRRGENLQHVSKDVLSQILKKDLLAKSVEIDDNLNALKAKAQRIKDLKEKGIEYRNVKQDVGNDDQCLETIEQNLLERYPDDRIFCFDDKLEQDELYAQLINEPRSRCVYADFSYCSSRLVETKRILSKSTVNHINVLLLGESGVGKSTFINALANYLMLATLEQAQSNKPLALMPASFLISEGDNFDERIIRFGDKDPNEDHDHPGQSVTQQCRSYVFTIDDRTKLRLIDTPGMGDTRGLDRDDLNLQHILSFINNLPHLNALCILLKPNEARLSVVLRSYFTRLVGFLGEHIRSNIIFCFTNTRATFFTPGNTGPLLRKMLQSHAITNIPFEKKNTFCFDSESFRYLIARLDGAKFDDYQTEEYKQSWITSVKESKRFLAYLCHELKSYPQNQWQSIEHAQFQMTLLVHPMLETLRNLFRNVILHPHVEYSSETDRESSEKIEAELDQLKRMILELACYSGNDDVITESLTEMIAQEKEFCLSENTECFTPKLCEKLHQFSEEYQQKRNNRTSSANSIDLSTVYQLIGNISAIALIKEQFYQEHIEHQEKEIQNPSLSM